MEKNKINLKIILLLSVLFLIVFNFEKVYAVDDFKEKITTHFKNAKNFIVKHFTNLKDKISKFLFKPYLNKNFEIDQTNQSKIFNFSLIYFEEKTAEKKAAKEKTAEEKAAKEKTAEEKAEKDFIQKFKKYLYKPNPITGEKSINKMFNQELINDLNQLVLDTFEEWMNALKPHYMEAHPEVMGDPSKTKADMEQWMIANKARFEGA